VKVGFPANILAYTDLTKPFNDCSEREPLCRIAIILANDIGFTVTRPILPLSPRISEPSHGSWLNLAESELGVLTSQCLDRRIPNKQILIGEITAWEHDRNANHTKADWQFTTKNARGNISAPEG
jgi:hypothetical protein